MKIRGRLVRALLVLVLAALLATAGCTQPEPSQPQSQPEPTQSQPQPEPEPEPMPPQPEIPPPVEVVSVYGPMPPINPGGPVISITLKNVADKPLKMLAATLELSRPWEFSFVTEADEPLPPGATAAGKRGLIGGSFSSDSRYMLTIEGAFKGGPSFFHTEQIQIKPPPPAVP